MTIFEESLQKHFEWKGKISVHAEVPADTPEALSLAYTPGVAAPCLAIQKDPDLSYELTRRWNTVAVITDGTAVLGLGDIGPEAGMPVMEGKCLLFKHYGEIDAVPLCIRSKDPDEIVRTVSLLLGSFGGINLEDISAPRCFEIERKLKAISDIPIFHDDQHGTAVIALAALMNALRLTGKKKENLKVVINGVGAAGTAVGRLMIRYGVPNVIFSDRNGAICEGDSLFLTAEHERLSHISNPNHEHGSLREIIRGADLFFGLSRPRLVDEEMVRSMNRDSVVFAMANPEPEILPEAAKAAGARIVGTGRSDYPNQINNVLAFPGIFRGALDVRAKEINEEMKISASEALSSLISDEELCETYIIPKPFDPRVRDAVARAVAETARKTGVARI
ncbi:MAG: NADP-dependent malic enzyme [Candidatus Methanomethylophilaceae archaeon]|nr:NADP-dependent malic enzyme [Candidatus Methanomethylophilaceae archaeon]